MTELERYEEPARRATLAEKVQYAAQLAGANLLPGNYRGKPGNVLLAVEYGDMLGVHPLTAIAHIHVVEGKPTQSAELMRASVRRAGHRFRMLESTTDHATAQVVRADDPDFPTTVTYSMTDAEAAGLARKDVWKKHPRNMLAARATSEVVRLACPEVLMGISYTPEELGADVDDEGNLLVSVEVVSDSAAPGIDELAVLLTRVRDLALELNEEQRSELKAWREAEGISLTATGATLEGARATVARLEAILDPLAAPPAPPAPAVTDDGIADAELVDPDEPEPEPELEAEELDAPAVIPAQSVADGPAADVIGQEQSRTLNALMRAALNLAGPARFPWLTDKVGRTVNTVAELTSAEADALIAELSAIEEARP